MVSTSGMFSEPVLQHTLAVLGADNILLAVDYPMESPKEAIEFLENSSIDPEDKKKDLSCKRREGFSL